MIYYSGNQSTAQEREEDQTYVNQLQNDTGLSIAELKNVMENRKEWMKLVNGVRVRSK